MADLTISAQPTFVEYVIGTADSGPWTIPFEFFDLSDIYVTISADEGNFELQHNAGVTVSGNLVSGASFGYDGGSVTPDQAYNNGTVRIYRLIPYERNSNYPITGPIVITEFNNELNKVVAMIQQLNDDRENFVGLPIGGISTDPVDLGGRYITNSGEGTEDDTLATNRQVDASGPNWLEGDDINNPIGTEGQWHTIIAKAGIAIAGDANTNFDLTTEFFTFLENRDANEATFQFRYRYQVDCYSSVAKETNPNYLIKIPGNSSMPFHFMNITEDLECINGNQTVTVYIDIKPVGVDSSLLYTLWKNLSVNTSEPR